LIAIVSLPHDVPLVSEGDHTANGLKGKLATKPMFAPLLDFRALLGIGPRVAAHTINAIPLYPFPAYEDLQLKAP
jgi:hypothetical protein